MINKNIEDWTKGLSEILTKLHLNGWEQGKKQVATPHTYTLDEVPRIKSFKSIKALIKSISNEIIPKKRYDSRNIKALIEWEQGFNHAVDEIEAKLKEIVG